MGGKFIRVYKKFDINAVKQHLLICGDLSAQCANCQAMDLKLDDLSCPKCQTEFKYISFRTIKNHMPKLHKIGEERPDSICVDFDDYNRNIGALKAREFLK